LTKAFQLPISDSQRNFYLEKFKNQNIFVDIRRFLCYDIGVQYSFLNILKLA